MQTDLLNVPHMDQYFGVWAMEEARFWAGFRYAKSMNLHVHMSSDAVAQAQAAARQPASESKESIAIIPLHGTLMKHVGSMTAGTSTVRARQAVRKAEQSSDISKVMLHIDSPGGTVAGNEDLADDIARLAVKKPVYAYIEDLGASAAYWLASQATHISANTSGLVGSIGTYAVVYDQSGTAAMEGVKAHVVRAGAYKGAGVPGTEVTPEQLAEMQRTVDSLNQRFLEGVSRGRSMKLSRVQELADGRVHIAGESLKLGLIDAVESFDQAFSRLRSESQTRRKSMSEHVTPSAANSAPVPTEQPQLAAATPVVQATPVATPVAATPTAADYAAIKAGCPGADAEFICSQLAANATLATAQQSWMVEQQCRIEASQEAAKLAAAKKPGVAPIGSKQNSASSNFEGDPVADYNTKVAELMAGGMDRMKASQSVAKMNPDLHAAYLLATNPSKKAQRLIAEKFE